MFICKINILNLSIIIKKTVTINLTPVGMGPRAHPPNYPNVYLNNKNRNSTVPIRQIPKMIIINKIFPLHTKPPTSKPKENILIISKCSPPGGLGGSECLPSLQDLKGWPFPYYVVLYYYYYYFQNI